MLYSRIKGIVININPINKYFKLLVPNFLTKNTAINTKPATPSIIQAVLELVKNKVTKRDKATKKYAIFDFIDFAKSA